MKTKILLNDDVPMDLDVLLESRLLIQANSGSGKSWCIKRILEQSHGKVQQIILDPEGEFSSLREKFDYVLAGKEGDTPADPRSAGLLAHKLLELGVSAIIDLYELHPQERKRFVRLFLEAMVNSPKTLHHPCLVVIDEAHTFVPEKGQSEAADAVIALASLGRKRGFCAILATQRISKLHKDAAAECNNKIIGRSSLDIDRKRAAEELGFDNKEQVLSLRQLSPGEFYAFGPAISSEVIKLKVGPVQTHHPKAGSRSHVKIAPPTSKIKAVLSKLADLPAEAEQELRTISEFKNKIVQLEHDKAVLIREKGSTKITPDPKIVQADIDKALKPHIIAFGSIENAYKNKISQYKTLAENVISFAFKFAQDIKNIKLPDENVGASYAPEKIKPFYVDTDPGNKAKKAGTGLASALNEFVDSNSKFTERSSDSMPKSRPENLVIVDDVEKVQLKSGVLAIMKAAAQYQEGISRKHLTVLTGYKRSSRDAYIHRLRQAGYITQDGENLIPTQAGIEALGSDYKPLPIGEDLRTHLMQTLPEGEKKILAILIESFHTSAGVTREHLSEATGYQRSSRDAYIHRLKSRNLIIINDGLVRASSRLMQD